MERDACIWVAGHAGMAGSAICRQLKKQGYSRILTAPRSELDLTRQDQTEQFFAKNSIDYVILAAARVGGIGANVAHPAAFGYENGMIQLNVMEAARRHDVRKLLFLGSSCIYPRECPQPMKEEHLLTGPFEPTNELYGFAKAFGVRLCCAYNKEYGTSFISCNPCNLYGEGDQFNPESGHVIGALIYRFHQAKIENQPEVAIWGDGSPYREFLYVDDFARACVHLMETYAGSETINVGSGEEHQIREVAKLIAQTVGYEGQILFDPSRPNGIPRKLVDSSRLQDLGWKPEVSLESGLRMAYKWYLQQEKGHALPTC